MPPNWNNQNIHQQVNKQTVIHLYDRMLFSDKMEWVNNTNHGYATTRLAFKGIMVRESIQSQRSHYCMTPFIRYSGIQLSGFGVRQSLTQVLKCEMTLHLHCGASAKKSTHVWRPTDLYTITTTKFYSLYANLEDIAPGLFLISRSTLVNKAGTWVISHSVVCSLTAENTKVPPPGHHRCCQLVWQSALTGYPRGQ